MFGNKKYDGVGYPTPSSIPVDRGCRTARIPAEASWYGVFMGLLETLTHEENWQQFDGGISREDAACYWQEIVDSLYLSAETEDCPVPFDVRQNATDPCILEKSTDDGVTWTAFADLLACPPVLQVKPTGQIIVGTRTAPGVFTFDPPDNAAPGVDIWTDVTPTYAMQHQTNDSCTAAANVANVFRKTYQAIADTLTDQPGIQAIQAIAQVGIDVSAVFGAEIPASAFFALANSFLALQALYGATVLSDAQFHDLVCIIKPTLSGTNGNWTVNGAALSTALAAKVASAGPLPWSFLNLIGTNIGSVGLNLATKTTEFASYDCTTGEAIRLWRHYDDFGVTNNGALLQFFMPDAIPEQFAFMRWRSYLAPGTNTLGNSVGATPVGWPPPFNLTVTPNPFVVGSDMWWVNQVAYPAPLAASAQPQIRKAVNNPTYNPTMLGGGIGTGNFLAGSLIWHHFTIGGGGGSGAWNYHLSRDYYTRSVYGGC